MTLIVLAAMTPSTLWLWYFCRRDKRREPLLSIGLAVIGGSVMVAPVMAIERWLLPLLPPLSPDEGFLRVLLTTTIVAGLVEELAKFAVVLGFFLWHRDFDEPVDGLIYAVACAMGFTAAEDFVRHLVGFDPSRLLNPPGHAMFAVFWGYELGQRIARPGWSKVIGGLALSIGIHGLWDAFSVYRASQSGAAWVPLAIFPLAMGLFIWLELRLQHAQRAGYEPAPGGVGRDPADRLAEFVAGRTDRA